MSNILLITPTNEIHSERQNWSTPHLGIWRLAGWLEEYRHTVTVWDMILDDFMPNPEHFYDIIGFSLTHDTLPYDLSLMRMVAAQHPDSYLIAGGIEASTNYQQIFEHVPGLHSCVIAEGESVLGALANILSDRWDERIDTMAIPSGITRTHGEITEAEFSAFNFAMPFEKMRHKDHWDIVKRLRPNVTQKELYCVRLNTSTFCNRACKFCSVTHVHKMATGHTCKPITMSGEDTKALADKVTTYIPETRTIYFNDDDFCLDRSKAEVFFEDPPKLDYHIQARTDTVDRHLLKHMAEGGCKCISFGIENCSSHILKDIGKGIDIEQVDQVIAWCQEFEITPVVLILLFCPTSTMEDMVINYNKLRAWQKQGIVLSIMSFIRPYHGSWYLNSGLHEIEYRRTLGIKQPYAVLPDDPDVRQLWRNFERRVAQKQEEIKHPWKGGMSGVMLDVLENLLYQIGGAL